MRKISQKSCINILITLFIISLGSFIFSLWPQNNESGELVKNTDTTIVQNLPKQEAAHLQKIEGETNSPTITLIAGDLNTKLKFQEGQTLYQIFTSEQNNKLVNMTGKEYKGIGFFITDIGSLHEKDGKYIMYSINGTEASVGISTYVPRINDVILFELK